MAEHDDHIASRLIFTGFKRTPHFCGSAEHREEIGGYNASHKMHRLSLSRKVELCGGQVGCNFHRPALLLHRGYPPLRICLRHTDELFGIAVGKGADEGAIDEAEDGSVCSDTE